ncbi:hypothetical protein BH11ACT5_BH11ACT5_05360 [soil metagenome]
MLRHNATVRPAADTMGPMPNPDAPAPRAVVAADGKKVANYEWGEPTASTVLLVQDVA